MDIVRWLIVGCFCALLHCVSFAASCPVKYLGLPGGIYVPDVSVSSLTLVCDKWSSGSIAAGPPVYSSSASGATSQCGRFDGAGGAFQLAPGTPQVSVGKVWVLPGGNNQSTDPGPDGCPDSNCPAAGTVEGDSGNAYAASSLTASICIGEGTQGCEWKPGGVVPGVCANGKCYQFGPFTATGNSCDPSAPGSSGSKGEDVGSGDVNCLSQGKCPVAVNGTPVCVTCGTKSQTETTSSSDSNSTSGGSEPPSSSGSNTTTTKQTTCEGGSCNTTTTTTTVNDNGTTITGTTTKSEPQTSFCAENPKAAVCKGVDDSKWGGACSGGFTCSGDAVQCAQAQASWKLACAVEVADNDPFKTLGNQVVNGTLTDADPSKVAMPGLGGDLSNSIDQTEHYASICPGDLEVPIGQYGSFIVPFSKACPYFEWAGNIGVALALVVAARIALGA